MAGGVEKQFGEASTENNGGDLKAGIGLDTSNKLKGVCHIKQLKTYGEDVTLILCSNQIKQSG